MEAAGGHSTLIPTSPEIVVLMFQALDRAGLETTTDLWPEDEEHEPFDLSE